ncbi:Uncharacterised protein [Moraxella lacunata]|uniref:Uncharacterized protein n=1 Tax=Moraxella lacunata TaxID=477 RepID=A0A378T3W2_MORLA|nr:hypothetical protein [Moraxella lacunata]STZ55508.1 Uncharacterised protein [Moraxella lacunata]
MNEKIIKENFFVLDIYQPNDTERINGLIDRLAVKIIETSEKTDFKNIAYIEFEIGGYSRFTSPFQASIDFVDRKFSISSKSKDGNGDIRLDLIGQKPSHRIGTYFMYKIVSWLKSFNLPNEEQFLMKDIRLIESDGKGENGIRRNKLYENMGIKITKNIHNNDCIGKATLDDLILRETWRDNIVEHEDIQKFIKEKNEEELELKDEINNLRKNNRFIKTEIEKVRMENRRLGFFIFYASLFCLMVYLYIK